MWDLFVAEAKLFNTQTFLSYSTFTLSPRTLRHYTEELYVRTQVPESVGPDIKWALHCQLLSTKPV